MRGLSQAAGLSLPLGLSCGSHRMPFVLQMQIQGKKLALATILTARLAQSSSGA